MKLLKKLMVMFVAAFMILSLTSRVNAATNDGSVTVKNAVPNEKYNIYKVFDLTYSGDGQTTTDGQLTPSTAYEGVAYTYTKKGDTDAFFTALQAETSPFTLTATTTANVYSVTLKSGKTADEIATFLKTNQSSLTSAGDEKTAPAAAEGQTTSTVSWNNLAYGYYYVTSSVGSVVTIDSTLKDVVIEDKNSIPSEDKKQAVGATAPTDASNYSDDVKDVQVGDHVWYQIEVKDGKGTDSPITVTDTLSTGLTNDKNVKVFLKGTSGETEVAKGDKKWTLTSEADNGFVVTFVSDYVKDLTENDTLYIRFSATVNSEAIKETETTLENNTSDLEYSHQHQTDKVEVKTYKFQLDKVENQSKNYADLKGARFELYRGVKAEANKVWFTKGTAEGDVPVLVVAGVGASAPTGVTGAFADIRLTDSTKDGDANSLNSSKVIFKGLNKEAYVLHETEAPKGYNIADDQTVAANTLVLVDGTITDSTGIASDIAVVSVVNNSGAELPSTGGIGTTVFHIAGAALILGAGILLISKKRMNNN